MIPLPCCFPQLRPRSRRSRTEKKRRLDMTDFNTPSKRYLLVSDFDQTLSFHDSGRVLADLVGIADFAQRVAGLSDIHLVQQGGELAYLLLHDPEYRKVRQEHLIEVGKRIRLKANIPRLLELLAISTGTSFRATWFRPPRKKSCNPRWKAWWRPITSSARASGTIRRAARSHPSCGCPPGTEKSPWWRNCGPIWGSARTTLSTWAMARAICT